jgi:hypothetical protein
VLKSQISSLFGQWNILVSNHGLPCIFFFCNNFLIFFYSRGASEVFNFTNGGSMGMAYLEKNEFKLGRKLT